MWKFKMIYSPLKLFDIFCHLLRSKNCIRHLSVFTTLGTYFIKLNNNSSFRFDKISKTNKCSNLLQSFFILQSFSEFFQRKPSLFVWKPSLMERRLYTVCFSWWKPSFGLLWLREGSTILSFSPIPLHFFKNLFNKEGLSIRVRYT